MRAFHPKDVPPPVGRYVHGLGQDGPGGLVFVSGQIPEALDGTIPAAFEDQCRLVWAHVGAVLREAGLGFPDLIKVTTFLADVRFADANSRVRREILGAHAPALTVVAANLLDPRWLLEIEAVACRSEA